MEWHTLMQPTAEGDSSKTAHKHKARATSIRDRANFHRKRPSLESATAHFSAVSGYHCQTIPSSSAKCLCGRAREHFCELMLSRVLISTFRRRRRNFGEVSSLIRIDVGRSAQARAMAKRQSPASGPPDRDKSRASKIGKDRPSDSAGSGLPRSATFDGTCAKLRTGNCLKCLTGLTYSCSDGYVTGEARGEIEAADDWGNGFFIECRR
jgi:hypothetical protein